MRASFVDRTVHGMAEVEWLEETYARLGGKPKRVHREMVWLRTDPISERSPGGIVLLPKYTLLSDGLPSQRLVVGTVLAVGEDVPDVREGGKVAFSRLYWMWLRKLEDGTQIGSVRASNIAMKVGTQTSYAQLQSVW